MTIGEKIAIFFITIILLNSCQQEEVLFETITPDKSGIHFSNQITENDTFNILTFEYTYNGGGVGIGDFNNDGLQDVFFTGNMSANKLYLNQGDFKFEDITESAGVGGDKKWNSGVAAVDINNDGWLDLYVCATAYQPAYRRTNELYINNGKSENGKISFSKKAKEYGLADDSHTTNAAFFDYDNDGDLDLYLLVNQMDENSIPSRYRKKITDGTSHKTDKLFRNDFDEQLGHAVFTDVSNEKGIRIEGFGLGVNICDFDRDGWKDIYVSNDYLTNDLMWINQGARINNFEGDEEEMPEWFEDRASDFVKHTSHSAMGNDVVDLNNDGWSDIVAVDMLPEDNLRRKTMLPTNNYNTYLNNERYGYQYQYVRNTLQLHQGLRPDNQEPLYSEVSMLSGISSTDWSWTPLIADFDNDGLRDIIVTNGFPKDVTDRDFMDYNNVSNRYVKKENLLKAIPSVKIKNYAYRNQKEKNNTIPTFQNVTKDWGITQNSFSNGAAYVDLDNDGDLDYVVNNINDSAFVYKNNLVELHPENSNWLKVKLEGNSKNVNGIGAMIEIFYGEGEKQFWENTPYRGYLSSMESGAHFGLGSIEQIDSLVVIWQEGKKEVIANISLNQELILNIKNGAPFVFSPKKKNNNLFTDVTKSVGIDFVHQESDFIDFNVQPLLYHKFSQYGPGLAVSDVNDDGLDDLYLAGSHFYKGIFFIQKTDGTFEQKDLLPGEGGRSKVEEELGSLFFDADNDGDSDLYLVSGGYEYDATDTCYQDRLFFNENGKFVLGKNSIPEFLSSGSCVRAADFDKDGDLDLFVGGRVLPYQFPAAVSSYILENDGKGQFKFSKDIAPELENLGLVCDALWTDYDNDGWVDLMLAGEYMPLTFLKNTNGKLKKLKNSTLENHVGWWNSLTAMDIDFDGDQDYFAGNVGLNTLLKTSDEKPIAIYTTDFDKNIKDDFLGQLVGNKGVDALPVAYFKDTNGELQEFPFFGRSDMEKQIIPVKKFYQRHQLFGVITMTQFINNFPDAEPNILKANYFQSSFIENKGDGNFEIKALPIEAQLAPVYGMECKDFNGDDFPDLLLIGNDYGTEVSMGKYDALNGLLLLGNGEGKFEPISMEKSGIVTEGDAKSMVNLEGADGSSIFAVGQNRGALKMFKNQSKGKFVSLTPFDSKAIIQLSNGKEYSQELFYGHSFLSQSARKLWLPENTKSYEIFDYSGKKRAGVLK